jgi:uncharacterized protein
MDLLYQYQEEMLEQVSDRFFRSLYHQLDWSARFWGISGLRGTGKTTMLLQHLKYGVKDKKQALYISADHPWFYEQTLTGLAQRFTRYGGKLLLIDEIHRYPKWSAELKTMYDSMPGLQVIFTASSVLDLIQGEADLSRRTLTHELTGLSFREYLEFRHQQSFPAAKLKQILSQPESITDPVLSEIKPMPLFSDYLQSGYFPFSVGHQNESFLRLLNQVINTVMEVDLQVAEGYSASNTIKMKKLLGVLAESAPFEPNISKLASRLELGRDTIKTYLHNLDRARLLNLMNKATKGTASLQKPDKIYLENTNFSFALKTNPDRGTLRETFFINQLRNAAHQIKLAGNADFLVNDSWLFEIGGPSKDDHQIRSENNAWLVLDEIEHPYMNRIPLWLFGFLY